MPVQPPPPSSGPWYTSKPAKLTGLGLGAGVSGAIVLGAIAATVAAPVSLFITVPVAVIGGLVCIGFVSGFIATAVKTDRVGREILDQSSAKDIVERYSQAVRDRRSTKTIEKNIPVDGDGNNSEKIGLVGLDYDKLFPTSAMDTPDKRKALIEEFIKKWLVAPEHITPILQGLKRQNISPTEKKNLIIQLEYAKVGIDALEQYKRVLDFSSSDAFFIKDDNSSAAAAAASTSATPPPSSSSSSAAAAEDPKLSNSRKLTKLISESKWEDILIDFDTLTEGTVSEDEKGMLHLRLAEHKPELVARLILEGKLKARTVTDMQDFEKTLLVILTFRWKNPNDIPFNLPELIEKLGYSESVVNDARVDVEKHYKIIEKDSR